jgi:hypothetical protein
MSEEGLRDAIEAFGGLISPLMEGEFSEKLYKVSVYVESIEKSWAAYRFTIKGLSREADMKKRHKAADDKAKAFEASVKASFRFARMNLDAAMVLALEAIAKKPKIASKADEKRKADALQRAFDGLADPAKAMLEHHRSTSDPLDKYLIAGPWGFEYLKKRMVDPEGYYEELCGMLSCDNSAAGRMVLNYSKLCRALDAVEDLAVKASEEAVKI